MTPREIERSTFARRTELLLVLLLTLAAFAVRAWHAGSYSLSEDEAAKWEAIQQYRQGHFAGVNAEHPMLMKLLAWGSLSAAEQWNKHHAQPVISPEAALRLPNVVLGAATTFAIYLLARVLLGSVGALSAAFFWAFMPLPIALNRLLKEETPLVFFSLLACYFYLRAKRSQEGTQTRRWLDCSAIAFGLSFASKYALQLFGLNALTWYIAGRTGQDSNPFGRRLLRFFLVLGFTFVLINPVILAPANLHSMFSWVKDGGSAHTGYNLGGQLYLNQPSFTPPTMPWYFYLWLIVVKTPIPVLAAIVAGSLLLLKKRNSFIFTLFVSFGIVQLFGLSAFPAKWIRYVLGILPFLFIAGGYAVQQLYDWLTKRGVAPRAVAFATMLLVTWTAMQLRSWEPYYSLYLNTLGGGSNRIAHYFTPDEISELDARQTAAVVCESAPMGGRLATSKPLSMNYYLKRCGRNDIQVLRLYDHRYTPEEGDLILREDSRRFFETRDLLDFLSSSEMPHQDVRVGPVVATSIYSFQQLSSAGRQEHDIRLLGRKVLAQQMLQPETPGSLSANFQFVTPGKEKNSQ